MMSSTAKNFERLHKQVLTASLLVAISLSLSDSIFHSDSVSAYAADAAKLHPSPELTQRWAGDLPEMKEVDIEKDVQVFFSVKKKGDNFKITSEDQVELFKSCGVKALDDYAVKCVQRVRSLKNYRGEDRDWYSKDSTDYLAVFNYKDKKASIQTAPTVDFGPYMAKLQRSIKSHWYPPKEEQSKRVKCSFTVEKDGTIDDIKTVTTDISEKNREAAEAAIRKASPLEHLPPGSPQKVNIEFTFDYNVFNGTGGRQNIKNFFKRPFSADELGKIPYIDVQIGEIINAPTNALTKQTPATDLTDYLQNAADKIKAAWQAPEDTLPKSENATFSINKDGKVSDLILDQVTGHNGADKALIAAVLKASPLAPLPDGVGELIQTKLQLLTADKTAETAGRKPEFTLKQSTLSTATKVTHAYRREELYFPKLSLLWNKNTITGPKSEVCLKLQLTSDGALNEKGPEPSITIYNTSGNKDLDLYAQDCIKKSLPFKLGTIKNNSGIYLARFDTKKMTASIADMPDIDWSGYVANLKRALNKHWHPPAVPPDTKIVLSFTLSSNGTISDIKTVTAGAPADFEKSARETINSCVPFWSFPGECPDAVNVQVTLKPNPNAVNKPPQTAQL